MFHGIARGANFHVSLHTGMGHAMLAKQLALAGVTIFALLAAGEFYMRKTAARVVPVASSSLAIGVVNDPAALMEYTDNGRRLIPNAHVVIRNHPLSHRDVPMDINAHGFRGPDIPTSKGSQEARILVLGDSITWSDSVPIEETFVFLAERMLKARDSNRYVRMINGGVGDIGLREEIEILSERGLAVQPDHVLIVFFTNDSRPPWGFAGELGTRGWLRRHSMLADALHQRLKLWQWIRDTGEERFRWVAGNRTLPWQRDRDAFLQLVEMARYDWGAAWLDQEWIGIDRQLERLQGLARDHHFKVTLVAFPVAFQVFADFVEDRPQQLLHERAKRFGFDFLDLLPVLRERRTNEMFFDQCHPSPVGHRVVAEAVAGVL